MEPAGVVPVDPTQGGQLNVLDGLPVCRRRFAGVSAGVAVDGADRRADLAALQ